MENYLRRGVRSARHRVDRRLDRAAVSRAHDALYLSDAWTEATWLGAQALKNPLDLWVYQEILAETRPELVVETGTYRGGSAFFLASVCDLLGVGEVVSIDVEPVRDDYPAHPRITYLGGRSSTDPDVVARYVLSRFAEPDGEVHHLTERAAYQAERLAHEISGEASDPLGEVLD